ncbi:unnamed protein product [Linum tenue]|uniref:Uncharacterized protein n=1 Tax=Linum tenue TaxID=586396 RepID=A0AAV0IQV2_9ROSI|nr:unnamed protein product [Linum tenue]
MAFRVLMLLLLSCLLAHGIRLGMAQSYDPCENLTDYQYKPSEQLPHGRRHFPNGFVFGSATAAYQEDIQRMKAMNLDAYRFSISWTRIFPHGRMQDGINDAGVQFYHNLLDMLIENRLEPYVTIWHWDTPQALEAEYGGFLSRNIVKDFKDYCNFLFSEYGDKVKKWITLNEPMVHVQRGYDEGLHAPGRCSGRANRKCVAGDSATEPYIVTHNLLLAHAAAYRLYEEEYKDQKGVVGITIVTFWFLPYNPDAIADRFAVDRSLDFNYGWYLDPIHYGRYPRSMVDLVGPRLPTFTNQESDMLKKSYDFIGLNYYTTYYAKNNAEFDPVHLRYTRDSHAITTRTYSQFLAASQMGSTWQYKYPEGLRNLLNYTKNTYDDPDIYITENGMGTQEDPEQKLEEAIADTMRVEFYNDHLASIYQAIKEEKVKVKGFFAWSYADNYEWNDGYSVRFGLNYVNYTDLSRHPKHSACWYSHFCRRSEQPKDDNKADKRQHFCRRRSQGSPQRCSIR